MHGGFAASAGAFTDKHLLIFSLHFKFRAASEELLHLSGLNHLITQPSCKTAKYSRLAQTTPRLHATPGLWGIPEACCGPAESERNPSQRNVRYASSAPFLIQVSQGPWPSFLLPTLCFWWPVPCPLMTSESLKKKCFQSAILILWQHFSLMTAFLW